MTIPRLVHTHSPSVVSYDVLPLYICNSTSLALTLSSRSHTLVTIFLQFITLKSVRGARCISHISPAHIYHLALYRVLTVLKILIFRYLDFPSIPPSSSFPCCIKTTFHA